MADSDVVRQSDDEQAAAPRLLASGSAAEPVAAVWVTLPPGYSRYRLMLENVVAGNDGAALQLRASVDHRASTTGRWDYAGTRTYFGGGNGFANTAVSQFMITDALYGATDGGAMIDLEILQSSPSSYLRIVGQGGYASPSGSTLLQVGGGAGLAGAAATDLKLFMASGDIAAIGRWSLIGHPAA